MKHVSVELNSWVIDESVEVSATQIKNNAFYMNARPKEESRRDEKTNRCYLIIGNRCFILAADRKLSVMVIAFVHAEVAGEKRRGKTGCQSSETSNGERRIRVPLE